MPGPLATPSPGASATCRSPLASGLRSSGCTRNSSPSTKFPSWYTATSATTSCSTTIYLPPSSTSARSGDPRGYADAITVIDSIGWFGAEDDALVPFSDPIGRQFLIRAVLFRLGSALVLVGDDEDRLVSEVAAYERILDALDM